MSRKQVDQEKNMMMMMMFGDEYPVPGHSPGQQNSRCFIHEDVAVFNFQSPADSVVSGLSDRTWVSG